MKAKTRVSQPSEGERPRFLSEADCRNILERVASVTKGGGYTVVQIWSSWTGNIRWARNLISTSGDVRDSNIFVHRNLNGAQGEVYINDSTNRALMAATRQAERIAATNKEKPQSDMVNRLPLEQVSTPQLFSEATYQLDAMHRATAANALIQSAAAAGMLSAGYIEVAAHSMALLDTLGRVRYFPYTQARYSVTVRDPKGVGSGWAGVDGHDWSRIDGPALSALALDKCLRSRNPVAIEPGRYTTILEPQAVCDFIGHMVYGEMNIDFAAINRDKSNENSPGPFHKPYVPNPGDLRFSKLGEQVVDERITISADPMDLELGFPPFNISESFGGSDLFTNPVYHPVTWIEHGMLTNLAYERDYAFRSLGQNTGLPNSGAFRMNGGTTSLEEMITTTPRGLLVTRLDQVLQVNDISLLYRGYTRDGVWLIEHGKISKPVKNLTFTESILFALNNIEQLGVPQRTFHPKASVYWSFPQPVIVPPMKIRDFSFTGLVEAV